MGTQATIGIYDNETKTVKSIYLHYDGYRSFAGRMLATHYTTRDAVEKLIALGDLSIIAPSTDCPYGHSFEHRVDGYCVAYGRDRGEQGVSAVTQDYADFRRNAEGFTYLFVNGRWCMVSTQGTKYMPVHTPAMTEMPASYFTHPEEKS